MYNSLKSFHTHKPSEIKSIQKLLSFFSNDISSPQQLKKIISYILSHELLFVSSVTAIHNLVLLYLFQEQEKNLSLNRINPENITEKIGTYGSSHSTTSNSFLSSLWKDEELPFDQKTISKLNEFRSNLLHHRSSQATSTKQGTQNLLNLEISQQELYQCLNILAACQQEGPEKVLALFGNTQTLEGERLTDQIYKYHYVQELLPSKPSSPFIYILLSLCILILACTFSFFILPSISS